MLKSVYFFYILDKKTGMVMKNGWLLLDKRKTQVVLTWVIVL